MKWYGYLICFVLIAVSVFCGVRFVQEVNSTSYINGSIDLQNKFVSQSFSYANTSVVFYHDDYDATETYSYEIDLVKVEDFNGKTKQYQVILNDYILFNSEITAGKVESEFDVDFYNTTDEKVCSANLKLKVEFLNDKTRLTLCTYGETQAEFLTQYFKDYGIRLDIVELKGE